MKREQLGSRLGFTDSDFSEGCAFFDIELGRMDQPVFDENTTQAIPLASFAGQPSSSIGVAFLKSYAAICLEGCVIVLACVIFSAFASSPPAITDSTLAPATIVWNYIGELIFNMLVLVGAIKMSDRLIRELMGDRKSTRLNSSHSLASRMPSSA